MKKNAKVTPHPEGGMLSNQKEKVVPGIQGGGKKTVSDLGSSHPGYKRIVPENCHKKVKFLLDAAENRRSAPVNR